MIPKMPVPGLDPRMDTGFPPSRSPLRRAKEGRKRSCSTKMLERRSIQYEAIALHTPNDREKRSTAHVISPTRWLGGPCGGARWDETIGGNLAHRGFRRN